MDHCCLLLQLNFERASVHLSAVIVVVPSLRIWVDHKLVTHFSKLLLLLFRIKTHLVGSQLLLLVQIFVADQRTRLRRSVVRVRLAFLSGLTQARLEVGDWILQGRHSQVILLHIVLLFVFSRSHLHQFDRIEGLNASLSRIGTATETLRLDNHLLLLFFPFILLSRLFDHFLGLVSFLQGEHRLQGYSLEVKLDLFERRHKGDMIDCLGLALCRDPDSALRVVEFRHRGEDARFFGGVEQLGKRLLVLLGPRRTRITLLTL